MLKLQKQSLKKLAQKLLLSNLSYKFFSPFLKEWGFFLEKCKHIVDKYWTKWYKAVVNKYGADPSCLVALIRTNTDTPGATVLQFNGEKDSSGNLIKTEDTPKYVYDVRDSGAIKKASVKKTDNDGYNYAESYVNYKLAIKYIIPQLDEMKKARTYENYFSDWTKRVVNPLFFCCKIS